MVGMAFRDDHLVNSPRLQSGYNSNDDDGDELFADYEHNTDATLPLSAHHIYKFKNNASHGTSATPFVTQPTQLLNTPVRNNARSTPPSVQVAATSPVPARSPTTPGPSIAAMDRGSLNRGIAHLMAPPGTYFRNPSQFAQPSQTQKSQKINLSDDVARVDDSSDDDSRYRSADIRPATFAKGGRVIGPETQARILESPKTTDILDFTSRFMYTPETMASKRSADDMANAYGSARRDRPAKVPRRTDPASGQPLKQIPLADIHDYDVRDKIQRMLQTLPLNTVVECRDALIRKKGNCEDAMEYLVEKKLAIDLTLSDNANEDDQVPSARKRPLTKPAARRDVQANKTIHEKYSNKPNPSQQISRLQEEMRASQTPALTAPQATMRPAADVTFQSTSPPSKPMETSRPRRRLVQRKREASPLQIPSSPDVLSSVMPPRLGASSQSDRQDASVIQIDSGVGSEDEEAVTPTALEKRLLNFINTCSAADLVDMSNQPLENVELVLSKRPFTSLEKVALVCGDALTVNAKTSKKRQAKRLIGQRLVEVSLDMMSGYEAVDELVANCEELGKSVAEEMKKWGIDAFGKSQDGELDLVDIESMHDSGIGTPSSSVGDEEVEPLHPSRVARTKKSFIRQPTIMSQEQDLALKDYQVAGLNWLALLFSKKLSCILADDMGLGKTCQVVAFLAHLYEVGEKGPHVIIVPGSTLENWLREFERFCPTLRVVPYYGLQKERAEQRHQIRRDLKDINVLVTTYDVAAKEEDAHFLRKRIEPCVIVYDEGHHLKNSQSQRYQQLMSIPAKFRLLLTGTPLQNNLQELVSLLAFIMPKVFRSQQENLEVIFKYKAKTTDTTHAALLSARRTTRARSMMTPFILRRKKWQVLKHLPEKTRREEYCEMSSAQASIYNDIASKARKLLLDRDGGQGSSAASTAKDRSNVLMDLRKAAIHPLLFRRLYTDSKIRKMAKAYAKEAGSEYNPELGYEDMSVMTDYELHLFCLNHDSMSKYALSGDEWMESGKVAKLVAILKRHKANGDRTLVFSQFVMVMNILEAVFETEGMPYSRLDGQTKMEARQELIDQFHADESIDIFMLSTKAGGAGINLACANKVIIFDSSFNPQDDVQAENRAHRVGQKREVEVVRLITRDTIEEQILKLGESKLKMDRTVAGEGGEGSAKEMEAAEKAGANDVAEMLKLDLMKGKDFHREDHAAGMQTPRKGQTDAQMHEETDDFEPVPSPRGSATKSDLKEEFMYGLKAKGLDMSAAV